MKIRLEKETDEFEQLNFGEYYKTNGVLFNEEWECLYYVTEVSQLPTEGQRLSTKFGIVIVEWVCYNVDLDTDDWFDATRVCVHLE